jgi:hypothetical protein
MQQRRSLGKTSLLRPQYAQPQQGVRGNHIVVVATGVRRGGMDGGARTIARAERTISTLGIGVVVRQPIERSESQQ